MIDGDPYRFDHSWPAVGALQPDDFEHVDPFEPGFFEHGKHGAVHVIDGWCEMALLFDTCWYPSDAAKTIDSLIATALAGLGAYKSTGSFLELVRDDMLEEFSASLIKHSTVLRPFDLDTGNSTYVLVLHVPCGAAGSIQSRVERCIGLVAIADVTGPSALRAHFGAT